MNLCFICPEYPPAPHGGVGTFTQIIARALVQVGHQVRVAGIYTNGHAIPAYEEDQGVCVWRIPEPAIRFGWVAARIRLYRLIRSWVRAGECALVESPDCYGWIAGWPRLSAPVVLRAHGSLTYYAHELQQHVDPVGHRLEAWAYRRADAWAAVSRHTAEQTATLFNLRLRPTTVLYNPIDVPNVVPPLDQRQRDHVVFTGTLTRKKGVVPLVDAWPAIKQRFPRAELHMYGKDGGCGEAGKTMESFLLRRLPVELRKSIKFHGHVPRTKVASALSLARVAVFPSFVEAFAIAPLEAMACGCPTIYSKRGSGPEVIQHGRNGLLVDPDQPSEIVDRIVEVLTDDNLARQLGDKGREHVMQNLTLENLLKKNEAFFRAVIRSFHARSQHGVKGLDKARCEQGN